MKKKSNPSTAVETNFVGSTRMEGFIEARHFLREWMLVSCLVPSPLYSKQLPSFFRQLEACECHIDIIALSGLLLSSRPAGRQSQSPIGPCSKGRGVFWQAGACAFRLGSSP